MTWTIIAEQVNSATADASARTRREPTASRRWWQQSDASWLRAKLALPLSTGVAATAIAMMNQDDDELLAAFEALEAALTANEERVRRMRERIDSIRAQRRLGRSYREIVPDEPRPLVVELLSQSLSALDAAGGHLRRTEAEILHREGMTMETIASLFGVTRQRVSTLLKPRTAVDA